MKNETTLKDRYLGCMLGLAIGDSLGAPYEFKSNPKKCKGMVGGFRLVKNGKRSIESTPPGIWTDDTAMTLCLADSLLTRKESNSFHQMLTYYRWYKDGFLSALGQCEGMGRRTRESLKNFELRGIESLNDKQDVDQSGNGSLMRVAPIALFYYRQFFNYSRLMKKNSRESSMVTHRNIECLDACDILTQILFLILREYNKKEIFSNIDITNMSLPIKNIFDLKTYKEEPPYITGSGYVIKTLEAVLWAFNKSTCFKDGALLAVNLGDDTDTVCSIYGALAGAYYGYKSIPRSWKDKLHKKELIKDYALRLYNHSQNK